MTTPRPASAPGRQAPIPRLDAVEALATPEGLGSLFGPGLAVTRAPLETSGRSGAHHERLEVRREDAGAGAIAQGPVPQGGAPHGGAHLPAGGQLTLVLKRNRLAADWECRRTGDTTGREGAVLAEPALAGIWDEFRSPFRAFAFTPGVEFGLLMDDLTPYLAPGGEAPIDEASEEALLRALARLHARFWESAALDRPWLLDPLTAVTCFSPRAPAEEADRARQTGEQPDAIFEWVRQGWQIVAERATARIAALIAEPREALARALEGLPRTLIHGNSRVGNFAYYPDGGVAAFDWAEAGAAPATLEIGWYLIINARRRARPADTVLERYRALLEEARGERVPDALWGRMVAAGLLYGAAMLLWDRALDLDDALPGAAGEWAWWIGRLEAGLSGAGAPGGGGA